MATFKDLSNQKFGRLTVIKRAPNRNKRVCWECQCDCGNIIEVRADQLRGGITKSCGCLHKEMAAKIGKNNFKDLTNQKFGKLTALYPLKQETTKYYWICQCECGNMTTVLGTSLTNGNTRSCGCIKSIGEANIKSLLKNHNIEFVSQYYVKIENKEYYYDFAIVNYNNVPIRLIEFDGIQHFGRISGWFTKERQIQLEQSDNIKNNYALSNKIPLVRIPYIERDNITLEMLLGDQYLVKEVENNGDN